jgi:outer membrane protein OmpA-like peptidoglycan-associated protein
LAGLVVLLPNEDGGVGMVNVKCGDGSVQLNKAGQTSKIYAGKDSACEPSAMSKEDIADKFGKTLAALPAAVARYILLFKTDTTNLESESVVEKDRLMADVAGRPAAEVTVEGHTDRVGSAEYNEKLSRRRAEYVRKALIAAGVSPGNISSNWHGEGTPAVDTSDDVPEAANRRVEVTIR